MLFISHNLGLVLETCDRICVMYSGEAVERGSIEDVFDEMQHPYTQALLSATPQANTERKRQRIKLIGELPSPLNPPTGCTFHPRCQHATAQCKTITPEMEPRGDVSVACLLVK